MFGLEGDHLQLFLQVSLQLAVTIARLKFNYIMQSESEFQVRSYINRADPCSQP